MRNETKQRASPARDGESSSSTSEGKGSGAGYCADYSDQSSSEGRGSSTEGEIAAPIAGLTLKETVGTADSEHSEKPSDSATQEPSQTCEDIKKAHRSKRPRDTTQQHQQRNPGEQLPQWNGVKIRHPMDPRIDLTAVNVLGQASVPARYAEAPSEDPTVIRPFFLGQGVEIGSPQGNSNRNPESSEQVSSEGFTSFFTTTHSGSGNSGSAVESSESEKKPAAINSPTDNSSKPRNGNASSSSAEKKVRIMDHSQDQPSDRNMEPLAEESARHNRSNDSSKDLSSSSSSTENAIDDNAVLAPPRVVTDISSSNRTDSAVSSSNVGTGTSGSGSGGNTASGSGSNQGSSGSGNEEKGSSEDVPRDEENGSSDNIAADAVVPHGAKVGPREDTADEYETNEARDQLKREKKIQDKKRKRLEMRREYEAQQQFESSESSNGRVDTIFRPGRTVTMDQALVLSRIARIIVKAYPPFLIVHTNAQYTRLTGVDSHDVVGKAIGSVLLSSQAKPDNLVASETAGDEEPVTKEAKVERLVASSGFGHLQFVQAVSHVGRNVTFVNSTQSQVTTKDERSNGTSLSGSVDSQPRRLIPCRASIAPIVSNQHTMDKSAVPEESDPRAKRLKGGDSQGEASGGAADPHRRNTQQQFVTHYIIQLEPIGSLPVKHDSENSISSNTTSVEARIAGLSKEILRQQKAAVALPQLHAARTAVLERDDGVDSDSSDVKDPVSAVG